MKSSKGPNTEPQYRGYNTWIVLKAPMIDVLGLNYKELSEKNFYGQKEIQKGSERDE